MATPAELKELEASGAPMVSTPFPTPAAPPVSMTKAILAGSLLILAFWPILAGIYGSWFDERSYMEHGLLVIPAAAYMVWTERDRLKTIPIKPSGWGVALLLLGALQAVVGVVAQWVWVSRTAFLISLVGAILVVFGFEMVRKLRYPLCTLILMIAPPTFVFERLTLSLQLLASSLGASCLDALGYSVLREGNILEMVGIKLSVEEACSGIRSLLAIIFMCVLYNYFFVAGRRMKTLILAMAIPIAIIGNAGRIVASGIAGQYNRAWVGGATHEAFGYVSVLIAALGCILLHHVMLYVQRNWRSHA
jgi:exosortase